MFKNNWSGAFGFGLFFGISKQLPRIECTNILPVTLFSVNNTFLTLASYIPPVYIPMAAVEALDLSTGLLSSLLIFGIFLRSETKWVEVWLCWGLYIHIYS